MPNYRPIDGPIEGRKRPLKDVDAAERAILIKGAMLFAPPLALFSFLILVLTGSILAGLLVLVGGGSVFYLLLYRGAIGATAGLFSRIHGLGSSGTPHPNTHWRAEALNVRGDHQSALDALELEAIDEPDDPGPCLRAARLCAEELGEKREAADWYRRAQRAKAIDPETAAYVSTRLAEIYQSIGETGRAMVELRRLIDSHPSSRYAEGARRQLAELKDASLKQSRVERERA